MIIIINKGKNVYSYRYSLKQLGSDKRHHFTAKFSNVGFKKTYSSNGFPIYLPTIVFTNVYCDNKLMTDHLWFNYTKGFLSLGQLNEGDSVSFDGRVKKYKKGPHNHQVDDYCISRPTKVKLTESKNKKQEMPVDKNTLIGYIMNKNKDFYIDNGRPYEQWYVDKYNKWDNSNIRSN